MMLADALLRTGFERPPYAFAHGDLVGAKQLEHLRRIRADRPGPAVLDENRFLAVHFAGHSAILLSGHRLGSGDVDNLSSHFGDSYRANGLSHIVVFKKRRVHVAHPR